MDSVIDDSCVWLLSLKGYFYVHAKLLVIEIRYVLFPLQLLLDASIASRSQRSSKEANTIQPILPPISKQPPDLHIADKIAEGVLGCIEELLLRCPITMTSQLSVLLRKLTAAAMLSSDEASEEFRHAAVKCLKIMFSGLQSCGRSFCGCKLSALRNSIISNEGSLKVDIVSTLSFLSQNTSEGQVEEEMGESCEDCPIEFLQSEKMSAPVGHLLSLFLQISESEASKGRIGSANLRIDALLALRILMLKVGAADALAFFLPGVASRLVKSLQSSKKLNAGVSELTYPTGAAGSSKAAEQSVRALSELLVLVLADDRNRTVLEVSPLLTGPHAHTSTSEGNISIEAALTTLRKGSHGLEESKNTLLDSAATDNKNILAASSGNTAQNLLADSEGSQKFRVERSKTWMGFTVQQIRTLLALCFPSLCCHSAPSVRLAVVESAVLLISTCRRSLEGFMPTLLESLLAMACDDWPHVASAAHTFLASLTVQQHGQNGVLRDVKSGLRQIICRLLDRLPKALYSGDNNLCSFLSRQLLAAMFFGGPSAVSECIFHSPAATTQFVAVMTQCFSFNLAFVGTLQKLNAKDKSPVRIVEVDDGSAAQPGKKTVVAGACTNMPSDLSFSEDLPAVTMAQDSILHQLPRLPPWFREYGGCQFYTELAGVLRLVGLSSMLGSGDSRNLFVLTEELVAPLRCMPLDLQGDRYRDQFAGQWQRRAAASIAVLNEVFFGASGLWVHASPLPFTMFRHQHKTKISSNMVEHFDAVGGEDIGGSYNQSPWEDLALGLSGEMLVDRIGTVLHEFTGDALWKPPTDAALLVNDDFLPAKLHALKDNAFLQQVILEGIGVLAVSIGKLFEEQGFLGSVLYLLLERLGCADPSVSSTAGLIVHIVSSACGYPSVRALIVASTDYIVDSLCRQLRHMDFFPNSPNMLVAVLRYTGAGQDLVPLLQEPMRSISLELEIPARQVHSENTLPMLRALNEVVKAARSESARMLETMVLQEISGPALGGCQFDDSKSMNYWEEIISHVKKSERTRQALQEIVLSCLNSSSPLMASKDQRKCLLALEITDVGMVSMACLDALAKREKEEKAKARTLTGHVDDISDFTDAEPPKLLPVMHRVWPHLAACLKHAMPSVLIRALEVIASVVSSCGGDFFTRRFQKDLVPRFLNILAQGTSLQAKSDIHGGRKLRLNSHETNASNYKEFAPASLLKVQETVLACIRDVAKSKKSAPALARSLEQLAGVVVGLACAVPAIEDSATQALIALSNIDADLIWILLADIAYGSSSPQLLEEVMSPPGPLFPNASQLLPPFRGSQEALWMQFSGRERNLNINSSQAWTILSRLESCNNKDSRHLDL
ncbi:hypothetical protein GOP47_0014413 [Adiantum capillus-veneris]|uniref:ARM repeat superfamily protein n=1 Tax=Adiantum capillus-veneris TaxID=13818 RepID=A0A9D4ULL7_ADICA|nr:hypothetical protein GOP47_0014413 [Adiantum capillus-veneris]